MRPRHRKSRARLSDTTGSCTADRNCPTGVASADRTTRVCRRDSAALRNEQLHSAGCTCAELRLRPERSERLRENDPRSSGSTNPRRLASSRPAPAFLRWASVSPKRSQLRRVEPCRAKRGPFVKGGRHLAGGRVARPCLARLRAPASHPAGRGMPGRGRVSDTPTHRAGHDQSAETAEQRGHDHHSYANHQNLSSRRSQRRDPPPATPLPLPSSRPLPDPSSVRLFAPPAPPPADSSSLTLPTRACRRPAPSPTAPAWADPPGLPGWSRKGGPARSGGPPFLQSPGGSQGNTRGGAAACCAQGGNP
jgi:hypothetical protein